MIPLYTLEAIEASAETPNADIAHLWPDHDGAGPYDRTKMLDIRSAPQRDGGVAWPSADVSDRKRPELQLVESEARLIRLANALPQMVWGSRTRNGETTYTNKRFKHYFGVTGFNREQRIAALHPDDRQRMIRDWDVAEATGESFEAEGRWRRRDGLYRWHKIVLVPVYRDNVLAEWLGTALDIDDIVTVRETLREKTGLLQLAQEAECAGLFDWNLTDGTTHLSPEGLKLFNLPQDRKTKVNASEWATIVHPEDLPDVLRETERAIATRTTYRTEFRIPSPDGSQRWILGIGRVMVDAGGRSTRIVGLNIDLTERKRAEETLRASEAALRLSEERLGLAMDAGSDGLWDWNVRTGDVWYSDRWQTMLGYTPGEIEGHVRAWETLAHPEDVARAVDLLTAHFEDRSPAYECEHRLRRKDGSWGWVLARGKVVSRDRENAPLRIVGTHIDIDARKAAEAQVAYMACHDMLTDLPNRTLFHERLEQKLAEIRQHGGSCAVLCLDLDRFKAVNDVLGHLAGDALLRVIAHRLKGMTRPKDTVARLGGDEFVVLMDDPKTPGCVAALADRLIEVTGIPVALGEQWGEVGLSIGIALVPAHGTDGDGILKRADLALYRAKAEGRNTHRFFEAAMDDLAAERRRLERDLRVALRNGDFVLHYQPQVSNTTGETTGFEALVRWHHPTRDLVLPSTFIALAEDTGLVIDLGEWVLREACREAARWNAPLKIAVNVSPRQFQHADLANVISTVLTETGLSPERLEIEITEGVIINDMGRALGVLRRLKGLGVRIAMDDFGTGHSSLATLQAFPFDTIKIDRSFVGRISESPQAAAIIRAVLGLGRNLGMVVVAEGVETEEQMRFLNEESCDEMQGFLFGKPQPVEQLSPSPRL